MKIVASGSSNTNTMSGGNYALNTEAALSSKAKQNTKERSVNSNFCESLSFSP